MSSVNKAAIIVLDGWGENPSKVGNAVAAANHPNFDRLLEKYPHSLINACGEYVGLPDGQMGNSEVGHLNIGAGRVMYQPLMKITNDMKTGEFYNKVLVKEIYEKISDDKSLHLLGLLSDGGVHSHIEHLKNIITHSKKENIKSLYVHVFLDGRDALPHSGIDFVRELEEHMNSIGLGEIATISGRYYAMDRDNRWERIEKAYNNIVYAKNKTKLSPTEYLKKSYEEGITDEFVLPITINSDGVIKKGDTVLFFNFRPDRAREMTTALTQEFDEFKHEKLDLNYYCMTQYNSKFKNVKVLYPPEIPKNTIGEYISSLGLKQFRTAETEKYPHVTFFFNGSREDAFEGEKRNLVASPKVATYDMKPEMSAEEVKDGLLEVLKENDCHFYLLNFANPDMVGHTGVFDAAVKAIEKVDQCLGEIIDVFEKKDIKFIVTADHGNADEMIDEKTGDILTQHSLNMVPIIIGGVGDIIIKDNGKLADLAPTILKMMGLKKPVEMTGEELY